MSDENQNPSRLSRLISPLSTEAKLVSLDDLKIKMEERFHLYQEVQALPSSDRDELFRILWEAQNGNSQTLRDIYDIIYDEVPVDMEEFLASKQYMNLDKLINPEKIELMIHFAQPNVRKFWCAAGSGSGKSFLVSLAHCWIVYNVMCLKRPDMFYMLGPRSKIAAINLSVGKDQSKEVVFAEILARLENSGYFRGKYKAWSNKASFPKRMFIFSGGSGVTAYFGYNTLMGSMDEASHMLDKQDRSLAEDLAEALLKSLNTRFPNAFKLFVISTLRAPDDFIHTQIERVKEDGICIVDRLVDI